MVFKRLFFLPFSVPEYWSSYGFRPPGTCGASAKSGESVLKAWPGKHRAVASGWAQCEPC